MADLPAAQIRIDVPPTIIPTPASTASATTFPPASTPSPTTGAPRKSGILFCVVGESFANPDLFNRQLCNYIVYPDLVAAGSNIVPIHGKTSWEAFRAGAVANTNTRAGVSFSAGKTGADNNTLDLVPTLRAQLTDIVQRLELSALGVLDFPYRQGSSVKSLEVPFKVFEEELVQQVKPMVFLGVGLISSLLANDFVSQVVTMKVLFCVKRFCRSPLALVSICLLCVVGLTLTSRARHAEPVFSHYPSSLCAGNNTQVVMVIRTWPGHGAVRDAIRDTVAHSAVRSALPSWTFLFYTGFVKNSTRMNSVFREIKAHGDLLISPFEAVANNSVEIVLDVMRWVEQQCGKRRQLRLFVHVNDSVFADPVALEGYSVSDGIFSR
ncbi:hypothetical protein MRX96_047647 [Rhipicephalus microplus]